MFATMLCSLVNLQSSGKKGRWIEEILLQLNRVQNLLPRGDNFRAHTQHSVVSEERSPGVIKGEMTSLAALVMDNRPMRTPKRRTDSLEEPLPEASDIP